VTYIGNKPPTLNHILKDFQKFSPEYILSNMSGKRLEGKVAIVTGAVASANANYDVKFDQRLTVP
jgi:hypothetical protein